MPRGSSMPAKHIMVTMESNYERIQTQLRQVKDERMVTLQAETYR